MIEMEEPEGPSRGPKMAYDPTATMGVPAPTAVAQVQGKPELAFDTANKIQTVMRQTLDYELNPQTTIMDGCNIEFLYPGTNCWPDLNNSLMVLELQITKPDGSAIVAFNAGTGAANAVTDDSCLATPINYLPATLWKSVSCEVGGVRVTKPHNYNPYVAYVDTLLSYNSEYKKTRLGLSGWTDPDPAPKYGAADASMNTAAFARGRAFATGQVVQWACPLHINICEQPLAFPPKVPIKFVFTPNSSSFCLMSSGVLKAVDASSPNPAMGNRNKDEEPAQAVKLKIVSAKIYLRLFEVDELFSTLKMAQMATQPFTIPLRTVDVKCTTMSTGSSSAEITLCNGKWPRRVIVGAVRSAAVNGNLYQMNPLYFDNLKMNSIHLRAGSTTFPKVPFTPNFDKNYFCREFHSMLNATFPSGSVATNGITPAMWDNGGCTLFVFDVTPDQDSANDHVSKPTSGVLQLMIKTTSSLDQDYSIIALMEWDEILKIGGPKEVVLIE
jgi:hypothetical protein